MLEIFGQGSVRSGRGRGDFGTDSAQIEVKVKSYSYVCSMLAKCCSDDMLLELRLLRARCLLKEFCIVGLDPKLLA